MDQKKGSMAIWAVFIVMTTWVSTSQANKFDFPAHVVGVNHSALEEMAPYMKYKKVDLGIDNLDDNPPLHIRRALANATLSDDYRLNQLDLPVGIPRFLEALAQFYSPLVGQHLVPGENVFATIGATGAVYDAFQGHTSPGDEWIVIQPAYTMYLPMIKMARGVPRFTNLKLQANKSDEITGQDWLIDREQMESLFTNKTKGILLNNPLNPLGKIYTLEELEFIAGLAKKYDTLVISDEAHEWIAHKPHIRIASLPGMWERTVTIGSSSKSFSAAGFRVGWAYGPANILNHLKTVHERTADNAPTPIQAALAIGFEQEYRDFGKPDSFFAIHNREVQAKRDFMVEVFKKVGLRPIIPGGGYCMAVDWTTLKGKPLLKTNKDASMEFVKWLLKKVGVVSLPLSWFYAEGHKHLGENYARFCFHKNEDTLKKAEEQLQLLLQYR
ncbi:aminotransferase-like venom protein 2 isoform X1 [Nasonia vitripennis]|uniref:Aminotransferase class I/classII large domain-containing protein n=1 Tax=Nasonia vitripennis TaxID=7425 RepID=A0A7M7LUV3_NASVI|nr:aminotransferase-like venom protein 2 precursor [Nasonia vitripennis]XP_008211906.1 aminotransferase-like venom protein 2 isoform X1 [Nasonia vitripennis]